MIRLSTEVTPGADHAARSASSFSAQERTVPLRMTLLPCTSTVIRCASSLRAAHQRLLDLLLELRRRQAGLDDDRVGHALDARQPADDALGVLLLVLPLDLALERHPALGDRHVELVDGQEGVPLQRPDGGRRDVGVGALGRAGQPDLDVVGHGLHAADPVGGLLGRPALGVGVDPSRERDDAVLDGHADLVGLDARAPTSAPPARPAGCLRPFGCQLELRLRLPCACLSLCTDLVPTPDPNGGVGGGDQHTPGSGKSGASVTARYLAADSALPREPSDRPG